MHAWCGVVVNAKRVVLALFGQLAFVPFCYAYLTALRSRVVLDLNFASEWSGNWKIMLILLHAVHDYAQILK